MFFTDIKMNLLFTADWHIKLKQKNVPITWQLNRYRMLFEKLHDLEKHVDLVILGGDIFDTVPNMQELSLFFEYLANTKVQHILYDGNHCATKKGHTFLHHLSTVCSKVSDTIVITEPCNLFGIDFIPYTHLKVFNPTNFSSNILCTHVRGEILPHVKPEIDLNKLKRWDVVLAGDLHSYQNSQYNILYPGSPLTISFHRNEVSNGVILFNTDNLQHEWVDLRLPQLLRKTVYSEADIVETDYHHTVYEIEGNLLELSKVDTSNKLLDKKLVNKTNASTLSLANLTIVEELYVYLEEIMNLDKEDILELIRVFYDYT